MKTFNTSTTGEVGTTLGPDDIKRAIASLKDASKQPYIVSITSRWEFWKLLKKSNIARNFGFYGGIPVARDPEVPPGIARFNFSDGTHKDVSISNRPDYLIASTGS